MEFERRRRRDQLFSWPEFTELCKRNRGSYGLPGSEAKKISVFAFVMPSRGQIWKLLLEVLCKIQNAVDSLLHCLQICGTFYLSLTAMCLRPQSCWKCEKELQTYMQWGRKSKQFCFICPTEFYDLSCQQFLLFNTLKSVS